MTGNRGDLPICAILLAGGQSRRMGGGDKCLMQIAGKTVLQRVIDRIGPQVSALALNANGDPARFDAYALPIVPDSIGGFAGPLAGVLTGMQWASEQPGMTHVLTVPTDAPFLPHDLVSRLWDPICTGKADMTCAESDGRRHPVVGLWPVALQEKLRTAMVDDDIRKVDRWTARYKLQAEEFGVEPLDPFFNMNRQEDATKAEELAQLVR